MSVARKGNAITIIGCGQCGSRIAATFDKRPSFLKTRRADMYPVVCSSFDTDVAIETDLTQYWDWRFSEDIHLFPGLNPEDVANFVLGFPSAPRGEQQKALYEQVREAATRRGGIGGHPVLGMANVKKILDSEDESFKSIITNLLITRGFASGELLVTANSLTGGTGSGFSPIVMRFMAKSVMADVKCVLNISVIPGSEDFDKIYPRNIVGSLYHLLGEDIADGIVLMDNEQMRSAFGCKNNYDYNGVLHEILAPILLAPLGRYTVPEFGAALDAADMKHWIRTDMGFGDSDLGALGYASGNPRFLEKPKDFLVKLATEALNHTTVECKPEISLSGIGVLCAPPQLLLELPKKRRNVL